MMKLYLAPIQGMTEAPFRNFYFEHIGGIDAYYAPFISPTPLEEANKKFFKDVVAPANTPGIDLRPQLLGNNASNFMAYAKLLVDMGYNEVNWNIGCPHSRIVSKNKGAGMLAHPDLIKNFLDDVCRDKPYTLTVKMRLGFNDNQESFKIIDIMNDYPIKEVTIHARNGKQFYTGKANHQAFNALAKTCKHPVVYNGDIFTHEDYNKVVAAFPYINGIMLGRGALSNPFLAAQIKGLNLKESPLDLMVAFHQAIFDHYLNETQNDRQLLSRMKEFWAYANTYLDQEGHLIQAIRRSIDKSTYLSAVDTLFKVITWKG